MIKILPDKAILGQIAEIERLREQCGAVKLPVSITLTLRKIHGSEKTGDLKCRAGDKSAVILDARREIARAGDAWCVTVA